MLHVLPPMFKPVLQKIKLAASRVFILTYDWIKYYAAITPYTEVTSLVSKQVCLGPVKRANVQFLLQKVELPSTFCYNFSQPVKT